MIKTAPRTESEVVLALLCRNQELEQALEAALQLRTEFSDRIELLQKRDSVRSRVTLFVGFLDRLKILLGAQVEIYVSVETEHAAGRRQNTESIAMVWWPALVLWQDAIDAWIERTFDAGYGSHSSLEHGEPVSARYSEEP